MRLPLALAAVLLAVAAATAMGGPRPAAADHKDNGHSGMLWPGSTAVCSYVDQCEMNSRTVNGQTINLRLITVSSLWQQVLSVSVNAWNSGTSAITGFNVFTYDYYNNQTPYVEVKAALTTNEQNQCPSQYDHGCVRFWDPSSPGGQIYMYGPYLTWAYHKHPTSCTRWAIS